MLEQGFRTSQITSLLLYQQGSTWVDFPEGKPSPKIMASETTLLKTIKELYLYHPVDISF